MENGIAHYLLAILPGEAQSLPAAADSLLASARWLSRPRAEARATPAGMAAQETAGSGQIHLATAAAGPVAVQETLAPPAAVIPPALAVSPALPTAVIPPVQADSVPPPPARAGEAVTSAPLTAPPPAPAQVVAIVPAEAASSPQTRPAPQVPEDLQTPPPAAAPTPPPVAPPSAVSEAEVRVAAPDARPLWKLARVVASVPRGARLLDLAARIEREQKGHLVITGYGLKHFPHGLEGFLDGYGWQAGPRDRETRVPFGNRWEVRWNEPPAEWRAGMPLTLTFEPRLRSDTPPDTVSTLPMRLEWFTLCGPRKDMLATFNALDWAEPEAPRELRRLSQVCRPATPPLSLKADLFADAQARQQVELQPPANWPVAEAGQGEVRRLVLAVDFPPGNASPNAADSLRAAARIYYIYTPEE